MRTRDRLLRKLDAADAPVTVAQHALEHADAADLPVLLEELPSYLESRGLPTGFINPLVAKIRPEVAHAADRLWKARQAAVIGHTTAQTIRNGVHQGAPPRCLMAPGDVAKYDPDG